MFATARNANALADEQKKCIGVGTSASNRFIHLRLFTQNFQVTITYIFRYNFMIIDFFVLFCKTIV